MWITDCADREMTAQVPEILLCGGDRLAMTFCPPLPKQHPRVVKKEGNRRDSESFLLSSTACWRRYQGTWEIQDRSFLLVALSGAWTLMGTEPLLADWFSGVLRVPRGKQVKYVHMGFASVFEEELHIGVREGVVIGYRVSSPRSTVDEVRLGRTGWPGVENRFSGDDLHKFEHDPEVVLEYPPPRITEGARPTGFLGRFWARVFRRTSI